MSLRGSENHVQNAAQIGLAFWCGRAGAGIVAEQSDAGATRSGSHRGELIQYLGATATVLNHALNAFGLSLNPAQAEDQVISRTIL